MRGFGHTDLLPIVICSNVPTIAIWNKPMSITTLSSREFNQDTSRAKKAAEHGPVFITDRGRPAHVLMTVREYQRLSGTPSDITDLLSMPGIADIDFEAPRVQRFTKSADLD